MLLLSPPASLGGPQVRHSSRSHYETRVPNLDTQASDEGKRDFSQSPCASVCILKSETADLFADRASSPLDMEEYEHTWDGAVGTSASSTSRTSPRNARDSASSRSTGM